MGRRCIVKDCLGDDSSIVSHRFPKNEAQAKVWKKSLQLTEDVEDLMKKYIVCARHFSNSDYRNTASNWLNTTAVPSLKEDLENSRVKALEKKKPEKAEKKNSVDKRPYEVTEEIRIIDVAAHLPENKVKSLTKYQLEKKPKLDPSTVSEPEETLEIFVSQSPEKDLEEQEPTKQCVVERSRDSFKPSSVKQYKSTRNAVTKPSEIKQYSVIKSLSQTPSHSVFDDDVYFTLDTEIDLPSKATTTKQKPPSNKETQTDFKEECSAITQTDSPVESTSKPPEQTDSDKFIRLMYPEFENTTKLELIDMLIESQKKIEMLETKNDKLEKAIRKLLD